MVVDIGGVKQGVSELLQAVSVAVCRRFEVKFCFPQFGGKGDLWGVGLRGVR